MKTKSITCLSLAVIALSLPADFAKAIDLLQRYPTQLTAGDANPEHARPWTFTSDDVFRLSQFTFKVGEQFKVETGAADLGIGHCTDGAVWAVLIPRSQGMLTSLVASKPEVIANIWLRFHPAQIHRLFPPDTVFTNGDKNLMPQMRDIVQARFRSSWHAGMNAMIPPPQDMTVFVDTRDGSHRFFMVNTKAQTAEYVAAFNRRTSGPISASSIPPVVIRTVPEAGSTNVSPGITEIKVTFSKEMMDGSWSWCDVWKGSTPEGLEKPKYEAGHRTCVLKVKLDPNQGYGYWLNTETYRHFQDKQGRPAVPYLLAFRTSAGGGNQTARTEPEWPTIIATSPRVGATDVNPAITEITVTFDRDMGGGFSWTGGGTDFPPSPKGQHAYWRDKRTCVLPVKLEAAHYYRVGINSKSFQSFRSADGEPARPSAIYFTTRGASEQVKAMVAQPEIVSLIPANGAQDVDPNLTEIRATFNMPMGGGFSWTSDDSDFPPGREGKPCHWTEDHKTCVLPVQLLPGHTYHLGLNGPPHNNFQSAGGVPLAPVDYRFKTRAN